MFEKHGFQLQATYGSPLVNGAGELAVLNRG